MKLSDKDIKARMAEGSIGIEPMDSARVGPMSVDLTLDDRFLFFRHAQMPLIDLGDPPVRRDPDAVAPMEEITVDADRGFILQPREFALGSTVEQVQIPDDLVGWLDGRSSLARVGLMVHATAHTLEPGWDGCITLEFFNAGSIALALKPGMRVCAVSFELLSSAVEMPYGRKAGAKYQGQRGPQASKLAYGGDD